MNDTIHVALSLSDPKGTYSRNAGAAMASIMKTTQSRVCFHVLHDETLNVDNKEKLSATVQKFEQEINFINVRLPAEWGLAPRHFKRWPQSFVYRLLLPGLLPSLNNVIHIDCDMFFTMDIKKVWDYIGEAHSMIADTRAHEIPSRLSVLGARLFRCGYPPVILPGVSYYALNLRRIREEYPNYDGDLTEFFRRGRDVFQAYDDTFLGIEFAGDILDLSDELQLYSRVGAADDINGRIFHLYGKPWDGYMSRADSVYWDSLKDSAWGGNIMPYIYEAMNGEYNHRHTSSCVKKLLRQLGHDASIGINKLWNIAYCNIHGMIAKGDGNSER